MRRAKAVLSWTTPLWIASDSPDILALFAGRDSFSPIRFRVTLSTSHGSQKIMIDLYAAGTSNGMRARIGLEECGLAYNLHPIDLTKGEQKSPSFLAMNPNGQIPVIVDSDGPGGKPVTLSQSVAVLMYCAEKSGKFLPKDPATRPAFWQALASAASDMSAMVTAIFTLSRTKDQHGPAIDVFKSMWKNYMKVWDDRLGEHRYAAGGEVTIADFALYGVVARVKAAQPALVEGFANVARWADAMATRPAVQRAMKFCI